MKLGMNILLWTAAATEEHLPLLESLKGWGYEGVEFPMFTPDSSPWSTLAAKLDDLGLGRTVVTVMPESGNPISEEPSVRQAGLDHLKACLDACAVLGADHLVGPLYSPCGRLVGRGPTTEEWAWGVGALREAAAYAENLGITLAVEPLNRFETYFLTCLDQGSRFVDDVGNPSLGLLYDTFHANIEEKDPVGAVSLAGSRLAHVHISENDRSTPGEGHVPFADTFAALRQAGYDGWLTVEAFGRAMPEVAAATSIWRDMLQDEETLALKAVELMRAGWEGAL